MSDQPDYRSDRERLTNLSGKVDMPILLNVVNIHRTLADYEAIPPGQLDRTITNGVALLRNTLTEILERWEQHTDRETFFVTYGEARILHNVGHTLEQMDRLYLSDRRSGRKERLFLESLTDILSQTDENRGGTKTDRPA